MIFLFALGLMAEALVILLAAKLVRDAVCALRGTQVNDLIVAGGLASSVTQGGYLVGVLLGFLGAVAGVANDGGFFANAAAVAIAGLVAIALQLLADLIGDRLIFRGIDDEAAIRANNLSIAVGKAAVSVATGLVLRGAMSDPEATLLGRVAWFAVAQAVMVLSVVVYCRLTPYDDLKEIAGNNLAAGFPIAGILLAVGFVMETALSGRPSDSTAQAALRTSEFLGFSLLLVYALRVLSDLVLLPRLKLSQAIVQQKNVGAGLQEGISFVLASLLVTFFLA
jgi:uncharacterized membrane protein YjfL (UPF0719 family)